MTCFDLPYAKSAYTKVVWFRVLLFPPTGLPALIISFKLYKEIRGRRGEDVSPLPGSPTTKQVTLRHQTWNLSKPEIAPNRVLPALDSSTCPPDLSYSVLVLACLMTLLSFLVVPHCIAKPKTFLSELDFQLPASEFFSLTFQFSREPC